MKDKVFTVGHVDFETSSENIKPDTSNLALLPTRDFVIFPGVTFPITLGREMTVTTARHAYETDSLIGVVCQLDASQEYPSSIADLYSYGVIAKVVKVIQIPDGPTTAIIHSYMRFRVMGEGSDGGLHAKVKLLKDRPATSSDKEFDALISIIKNTALELIRKSADGPSDLEFNLRQISDPTIIVNLVSTQTPITTEFKIDMLKEAYLKKRAYMLLTQLSRNDQMLKLMETITERTKSSLGEQQRNAFLAQQMESIRQELYGNDDDASLLRKKAEEIAFSAEAAETFSKEVDKLSRLNPSSPDYSVQYSYLDLLTQLPWGVYTEETDGLNTAESILEEDHYGLEKVKERIVEHLAVMMNTPDAKAPILCLVGAPGVGKTSLGQSIARALGRKYQRVSLGGLHDEAEIRGHRRTYIGAMPGRIIDAVRRAGSSNPVLLLDEIDKIGSDFKGDPSAALLEVLDPEQNSKFHDNYVDMDFDLSKVMFIATANTLSSISQPLIDRMEIIDISGYVIEEKIEIASRHLIPRLLKENALTDEEFSVSESGITAIIENYTSESGVRQLEKQLASIVRKIVRKKVSGSDFPHVVEAADLKGMLGAAPFAKEKYEGNDYAGVVMGLAWTSAGGEILYIEVSMAPGKTEKLTITGNLGNVMKESAIIALQYIRSNHKKYGIDPGIFEKYTMNLHVPEGAVPKDGPSAGLTMVTAMVSALTQRKVRERVAMTGEITLRGRVLPVGGIKEKILAAKRAGATTIILSEDNRKDIEEIPQNYLSGMEFKYVKDVSEVIDFALLSETVENPVAFD